MPYTGDDYIAAIQGDVKGLKIAYSPDLGWAVDPRVRQVVDKAVDTLSDLGCKIEQVPVTLTEETYSAEIGEWATLTAVLFEKYATPENRPRMTHYVLELFEQAKSLSAVDYINLDIIRSRWYDQVESILANYDFLVCPTLASLPPSIDTISFGPQSWVESRCTPGSAGHSRGRSICPCTQSRVFPRASPRGVFLSECKSSDDASAKPKCFVSPHASKKPLPGAICAPESP